jgi:hypothetical protein
MVFKAKMKIPFSLKRAAEYLQRRTQIFSICRSDLLKLTTRNDLKIPKAITSTHTPQRRAQIFSIRGSDLLKLTTRNDFLRFRKQLHHKNILVKF